MDIEKEYSCLERNGVIFHKMIDCDEDYRETLPQYADDILRIIRCDSNSFVASVSIVDGTLVVDGKTEVCITYYNDQDEICYTDFDRDFSKKITLDDLSDKAFASVVAVKKYINYRIVNQRRVDVHISLSLNVSVYDRISCPCLCACDNSRLLTEEIDSADVFDTCISKTEFDEEFSIPSGQSGINRIISHSADICVSESRIIKDKALVKMTADVTVLYCDDDNNIQRCEHTFTASKIIEAGGLDADDIVISNAEVGNIYCKAKSTTGDNLNMIEIYGDISISCTFIKQKKINLISDGYVVGHNSRCDYTGFNCIKSGLLQSDILSEITEFTFNTDIKKIYDISVAVGGILVKNEKIFVRLVANAFCQSSDDTLCCCTAENEISIDITGYNCAISAICLDNYDYTISSDRAVNVRMQLKYDAFVYNEGKVQVLCEIDADDERIDYPALTVYFGTKDESVWDIAKRFSSDTDMIRAENDIVADVLEANKILIIPGI